jgi:hypothetical protein
VTILPVLLSELTRMSAYVYTCHRHHASPCPSDGEISQPSLLKLDLSLLVCRPE